MEVHDVVESPYLCEASPEFQVPKPVKLKKRSNTAPGVDGQHTKQASVGIEDGSEARKVVVAYMKNQNRPYSAQNIMDNLHGIIPRTQLINLLNDLSNESCSESPLLCKDYGKSKIFLIRQNVLQEDSNSIHLEDSIKSVENDLQTLQVTLSTLERNLLSTNEGQWADMDLPMLSSLRDEKKRRYEELLKQVQEIRDEQEEEESSDNTDDERVDVTEETVMELEEKLKKITRECRRRRQKCYDILEAISEVLNMSIPDVMNFLDLEVDP